MSAKPNPGGRSRRPRARARVAACALPHERDEAPDSRGGREHAEIAIAERDVREGRVDTDNYTRVRETFRRRR